MKPLAFVSLLIATVAFAGGKSKLWQDAILVDVANDVVTLQPPQQPRTEIRQQANVTVNTAPQGAYGPVTTAIAQGPQQPVGVDARELQRQMYPDGIQSARTCYKFRTADLEYVGCALKVRWNVTLHGKAKIRQDGQYLYLLDDGGKERKMFMAQKAALHQEGQP